MLGDLLPALVAAMVAAVLPGWFWATLLCPSADLAERLAYSVALSMTLVPAVALVPARLFGLGVTLPVALISPLLVFFTGLAAYLIIGPDQMPRTPALPAPAPPGVFALAPLVPAFLLALAAGSGVVAPREAALPVLLLLALAGVAYLVERRRAASPEEAPAGERWRVLSYTALAVVLVLVLVRGYLGPVLYDWPYLRGTDQFSHAVMANEMLTEGHYESYLVYPPGLHTLDAVISRLSGLEVLDLFPLLAPALLALPALGLYALGRGLWGWEYGVLGAAFGGLLLGGTYANIAEARYPNLVSAQFLMVLAIAALIRLYHVPSARSGLLFALLGSSVVLYHQVASLYMALLLAVVGMVILPYVLLRERKTGVVLFLSLALLFALSVVYAWDTYDLSSLLAGLAGGSETGAGGEAVSVAIGSQPPLPLGHLLVSISAPVLWLGLLGAVFVAGWTFSRRNRVAPAITGLTLLLWGVLLFAGSRTAYSGFPERFERDLGMPLALLAALASVMIFRAPRGRGFAVTILAVTAALVVTLLVGIQGWRNMEQAAAPTDQALLTPGLEAAGTWLRENNDGGNIITPAYLDRLPNRAALALGGYTGLQSFAEKRIKLPRSLPPAGRQSLVDALWVLEHPDGGRTRRIIEEYDVRYVMVDKGNPAVDWRAFEARSDLYRVAFENEAAIVFEPRRGR